MYQCLQLALAGVDDYALGHVRQVVEALLYLLGVDVLAAGAQNHILVAAADKEVVLAVHGADVAGVHPSVLHHGIGGLGVFVIALHHVVAAHPQQAGDIGGVVRVDAGLHTVDDASARALLLRVPLAVRNQRAALGHAVADGEGEAYLYQEVLDVLVEGGTADNQLDDIAAEGLDYALADAGKELFVNKRDMCQHLHQRLVEHGEDACANDFVDNQRHGHNQLGPYLGIGRHDNLGRGGTRQEVDVAALDKGMQHLHHQAKHVGEGQHANHVVAGLEERQAVPAELQVAPQGVLGEHNAL